MRKIGICLNVLVLAALAVNWWFVINQRPPPQPAPPPVAYQDVVRTEQRPDVDDSLREPGRSTCFYVSRYKIGDTPYTARMGPVYYQDASEDQPPAFYSVEVCFEDPPADQPPERSPVIPEFIRVLFRRDFRLNELPKGFLERSPEEIVSYDPSTLLVTFHTGDKPTTYRLLEVDAFFVGEKQVTIKLR